MEVEIKKKKERHIDYRQVKEEIHKIQSCRIYIRYDRAQNILNFVQPLQKLIL